MGDKQVYSIEEGRKLIAGEGKRLKAAKRGHPESELQQACIKWFRVQYARYGLLLFAIPNGGARSKVEAKIMTGEGVVPGVADLFLSVPAYGEVHVAHHGFYIEMKATTNMSENQKAFRDAVINEGYKYEVCRSVDQFMSLIAEYLK